MEALVRIGRNGRSIPSLAQRWEVSEDGLTWRVHLQQKARFHSGNPVTAGVVQKILQEQLPQSLGPAFDDVAAINATSESTLEFSLRQPSPFLLERLDDPIQEPGSMLSGTGAYAVTNSETSEVELQANAAYYGGKPLIGRMIIRPYVTVRSAWADLLRGQVDMLFDVGVDALDSLASSNEVKVFTFQRGYAYLLVLNFRKPYLRDAEFRRQLNAAIDRDELVKDVLRGHGTPADGVVWPYHWAYTRDLPRFQYQPRTVSQFAQRRLTCIFNEPAYERLALVIQKQLQAIGVNLELKMVSGDELAIRLRTGDFDMFLADFAQGPNLIRPYLYWHSAAPYNFGNFSSKQVDSALDIIRHATNDATYKRGVAAFQQAIVEDPPAIFLAWRERARAVSARFMVPAEPGGDILAALHLWRPVETGERFAQRN